MLEYLILLIVGLVVGSFLSVVIYRETQDEETDKSAISLLPPWVLGRSYCDHCKKALSWYENIPLLSFIVQQGKCRHCHKRINVSYPLIEMFTAFEFVWIYWLIQRLSFFRQMEGFFSLGVLVFWLFIFSLSIVLSIIDIKSGILPDSLVLTGSSVVALLRLLITGRWEFILTGLVLFIFFLFLYLITQGKGIGFGDVKLAFFIGVVLGWWQWALVAMFIAFLTGAVAGVILIVVKRKTMKSSLPFGPFLLGGMLIAKILGEYVWGLYMSGV
jgi:prepilin signal peptidase PulO-like enzyme (type II secretory pathway)